MTYSEIIITFNTDLALNQAIGFWSTVPNTTPQIYQIHSEYWFYSRSGTGQVAVGTATATPGERSAINFVTSFNLDYNSTNVFEVSRVANVVTIKSKVPTVDFSNEYSEDNHNVEPPVFNSDVTFVINNYEGSFFTIDSVTFLEATTNPTCTHYKVSVTTSELANIINGPVAVNPNSDNPFTFEMMRGMGFVIDCENASGQTAQLGYLASAVPGTFNSGFFNLTITNSPSGATVQISANKSFTPLVIEYSLNNITWQTESEFVGLAPDDYTLYVRDGLGCSFTMDFTVNEFGNVRIPYFLMPKSNSIRFANRVTWGDCANYKTDENTLSCEADVKLPKKEIQRFQSCDVITTQFRSNYTTNSAVVIKEDGTEVAVPVLQVTNNMGLKDKRDARKFNLGNGKTGIYFVSGNIYDYDTGVDTGEDYILNGLLPDWATVGTYIKIDTAWYVIEDTVFNETVNAYVLVITNTYTGADVPIQVSVIYDLENFEEFEFTIDFVAYINEFVQVRVNANDDVFDDIEQLSETISVKIKHIGTVEIRYKNSKNTDVNYSRGLEHKIRLMVEKISGRVLEESETDTTDTTARLLESEVYEMDEFAFSPLTTQMMRKLVLALSHDTVFINSVSYIKNDTIAIEGPLEDTNYYDVVATMIKGTNAFNSNISQGNTTINSEATELPGLVESDSGYVSYT